MAKCDNEDTYSKEVGFMLCVMKKKYGNKTVKRMFERYVYNTPNANYKGATVVEEKPCFRKPNVTKHKIKNEWYMSANLQGTWSKFTT
jgi:hypothetical protein